MMVITKVFDKKNQVKSKAYTFEELVKLNPNDQYTKQKAAGSIGGSRTHGYLETKGSDYRCTRDQKREV